MAKHKIKFINDYTTFVCPVTLAVCECGWTTRPVNQKYEYVGKVLKEEVFEHLVDVGIIDKKSVSIIA